MLAPFDGSDDSPAANTSALVKADSDSEPGNIVQMNYLTGILQVGSESRITVFSCSSADAQSRWAAVQVCLPQIMIRV